MRRLTITVARADLTAEASLALIGALNDELRALYPEPGATHFRLDPDEVSGRRGAFLIVYQDGAPVGCGAFRLIDSETAELKRMYVAPEVRGTGLGRRLVTALEAEARALGVRRLVLETGVRQTAALALYRATGFHAVPLYGEYCLSPDTSICLGKELPAMEDEGLAWQMGVWDRMAQSYEREVDRRFTSVVDGVVWRARLQAGEQVLDLGTGTGAVAIRAASAVGASGHVTGVDISGEMLARARERVAALPLANVTFREGRAEAIPADSSAFDVVLASLSLMFVIDRAAAAREVARVLRPGGRFVAAVWAGPADCDIVRFQQTAGSFAPGPAAAGVGPGALADTKPLLTELEEAGVHARVESEVLGFDFGDFESAWDTLAAVTTAALTPERRAEAKQAVKALMWPAGDGPRHFRNTTQFVVGTKVNHLAPGDAAAVSGSGREQMAGMPVSENAGGQPDTESFG